jgi:competence protein ComEC
MHQRKSVRLIALITVLTVILLSACTNPILKDRTYRQNDGSFSVHYLDVGQGDSALIYFPDGKTMLIDTGNGSRENDEYLLEFLKRFSVNQIDYLVLTHPDSDHIGGAVSLIEKVKISRAYVPYIVKKEKFPLFKTVYDALTEKAVEIKISCMEVVKREDCSVAFLTPNPPDFSKSEYDKLNGAYPTESDINNVSPLIYVEYKGVRFLFTGDAGQEQEEEFLDNEGIKKIIFKKLGVDLKLDKIDFLKVSHHGSADGTSGRFVQRIRPKNAIISVGGKNMYGHPSSQTLHRLLEYSPEHKLYRTDVCGTVSVFVNENGIVTVLSDNNCN